MGKKLKERRRKKL